MTKIASTLKLVSTSAAMIEEKNEQMTISFHQQIEQLELQQKSLSESLSSLQHQLQTKTSSSPQQKASNESSSAMMTMGAEGLLSQQQKEVQLLKEEIQSSQEKVEKLLAASKMATEIQEEVQRQVEAHSNRLDSLPKEILSQLNTDSVSVSLLEEEVLKCKSFLIC